MYKYSSKIYLIIHNYSPKLYLKVIPARIVVIGNAVEIANFREQMIIEKDCIKNFCLNYSLLMSFSDHIV